MKKARFHLPGLFEFFEFYKVFLPLYYGHPEYFLDWCEIGSLYGAPEGVLWGGGRTGSGTADPREVLFLLSEYGISGRLTFSNSLLQKEHLGDRTCNRLAALFARRGGNGVILHSDLLLGYLQEKYPGLYYVSSTTKVLTEFDGFLREVRREEFRYVVPDFRLNRAFPQLKALTEAEKEKVEFLCNECCRITCRDRKACYENVSARSLGLDVPDHICKYARTYRFSEAMKNPAFIGTEDIRNLYLPLGFTEYKIEGRGLGTAVLLEFLLYYMTKPEYCLTVREEIYLDSMLDLF